MPITGQKAAKLRGFLRELTPRARAMLLAELERSESRGEPMPGMELIIRELREVEGATAPAAAAPAAAPAPPAQPATAQPSTAQPNDDSQAAQLFFAFLEPFFVDDDPEHPHMGRLPRAVATPIWEWICRDLLPAETAAYVGQVTKLLAAKEQTRAMQAANAFQDRVVQAIEKAVASVNGDDKERRKLAHQIGTPRAYDDIRHLTVLLKTRDVLAVLAGKLPTKIRNLADDQIASITAFVDSTAGRHRELYVMALVLVMSRLASPWQLIRIAVRAADSDFPARVAESPYAPAVPIALAELERLVRELESDLQNGQAMAQPSLLKDIHDAARGLRTEIDLSADSPWARALAGIRSQLAFALRSEIESVPGRVRRLLRVRGAKDIVPGSVIDAGEVADTEALIGFVAQCRTYAHELAINEMTMRAFSEVQNYLETHVEPLLEGLRMAGKTDRSYRQSQFDAAVRFCSKVFGAEYAQTLVKAADVAQATERKPPPAAAKA
ncbi:MAG TPA: hypothetical protein VFU97_23355 [Xanthobacteraceae bacterium]|nr:hypothetical protein [Xanthobacteraceae bacterium]